MNVTASTSPLKTTLDSLATASQRMRSSINRQELTQIVELIRGRWQQYVTEVDTVKERLSLRAGNYTVSMTTTHQVVLGTGVFLLPGTFKTAELCLYFSNPTGEVQPAVHLKQNFKTQKDLKRAAYFAEQEQKILQLINTRGCEDRVVQLFYSTVNSEGAEFVVELCPKGTLIDILDNSWCVHTFSQKILPWMRDLGACADLLDRYKVIHGDFKGDNLGITADGRLKLFDFGFSRLFGEEWNGCGTAYYLPPERLTTPPPHTEEHPDKLNSWSLGCTLYLLLLNNCSVRRPEWFYFQADPSKYPKILDLIASLQKCFRLRTHPIDQLLSGLLEHDPSKRLTAASAKTQIDALTERDVQSWQPPHLFARDIAPTSNTAHALHHAFALGLIESVCGRHALAIHLFDHFQLMNEIHESLEVLEHQAAQQNKILKYQLGEGSFFLMTPEQKGIFITYVKYFNSFKTCAKLCFFFTRSTVRPAIYLSKNVPAEAAKRELEILQYLTTQGGGNYVAELFYAYPPTNGVQLFEEFCSEGTLKDVKSTLPQLKWMGNLGACVAFLDQHRVIHGNLNPESCGVTENGEIKLISFGHARSYDSVWKGRGIPRYLPPEILLSKEEHPDKVNSWQLGCTLYELLLGSAASQSPEWFSLNANPTDYAEMFALIQSLQRCFRLRTHPIDQLLSGLLEHDPSKRLTAASAKTQIDALTERDVQTWQPPTSNDKHKTRPLPNKGD